MVDPAPARPGMVWLVGAGPGDAGLLTVRGRDVLAAADLVLYDGLVNPELLRIANGVCERTARVLTDGDRRVDQASVNSRLIEASRQGLSVCRLKGGDPYIFGRGSEEAAALAAAGLPFEVVPGVTAATACGAYAGFSLTHREIASAVALVTGHERPGKPRSMLDYDALAAFPGTLVFYMGLHRLPGIAERLIAAGKSPATPAAVVSRASLPSQVTVEATLAELPAAAAAAKLDPPSLIVIGECVSLRRTLDWFESRPLHGVRIAVCRAEHQAAAAVDAISRRGGVAVVQPLLAIDPPARWDAVDAAVDSLAPGDWVALTSSNGVDFLMQRLEERELDARVFGGVRIACVGPSTAGSLAAYGLRADLVPYESSGAALAASLKGQQPSRVWFFAADRAGSSLEAGLDGVEVRRVETYRSRDVPEWDASQPVDWIALSSTAIAEAAGQAAPPARCVAISEAVAAAGRAAGLKVDAVAADASWHGMLDAIEAALTSERPSEP